MKNLALARNRAVRRIKNVICGRFAGHAGALVLQPYGYLQAISRWHCTLRRCARFSPFFYHVIAFDQQRRARSERFKRVEWLERWSRSGASLTKQIVGDVILIGKRKFWNQPNQHYHHGMRAGENTLNAHCARAVTRMLVDSGGKL